MYRLPDIPFVTHFSINLQSLSASGLTPSSAFPPSFLRRWVFLWSLGMAHWIQNLIFTPCRLHTLPTATDISEAASHGARVEAAGTAAPPAG